MSPTKNSNSSGLFANRLPKKSSLFAIDETFNRFIDASTILMCLSSTFLNDNGLPNPQELKNYVNLYCLIELYNENNLT